MGRKIGYIVALIAISISLIFAGCGGSGGGSGDGGSDQDAQERIIVSGSVMAPNGQVAFKGKQKVLKCLANILIPPLDASISGLLNVPDGAQVDLIRLNDAATPDETLAMTTTEAGKYSFDFDELGLDYSHDLAVIVSGIGGVQMRAFAVSKSVNIDPVSEAVFRLIDDYISTTPGVILSNFTVEELKDLNDSIDLLTSVLAMECLNDLEDTVVAIQDAAEQDPAVQNFIASAAQPGQSSVGPGDVANLFPMNQGDTWNYIGTTSENGGQNEELLSANIVTGEKQINGTLTTVVTSLNPDNPGVTIEEYLLENSHGIEYWGNNDPDDLISPQIIPYEEIRFPVKVGRKWKNLDNINLQGFEDLDGDGKNESVTLNSTVEVLRLEDVSTQLDDFFATMLIENTINYEIVLSSNGSRLNATGTQSRWYAAGIGPVKINSVFSLTGAGIQASETQTSELKGYRINGKGKASCINSPSLMS